MGRIARFVRTWIFGRLLKRNPIWAVLLWLVGRLRRSRRAALDVPLSPVRAGLRVGSDFLDRRGLRDRSAAEPAGELDALGAFNRSSFDPAAVPPATRRFLERTDDYRLTYRVRWGVGFRTGARVAAQITSRIEQLNLPGTGSDWRPLAGRFVAVDVPGDPREGVRGWVRENAAGEAVFVALYGTHTTDGERFVNVAVPLPGGNLSTVLRPRNLEDGVEWTTDGGGDPGLYLVTPIGPFRLPIDQRFRVWVADDGGVLSGEDPASSRLRGVHEMRLLGATFLRIDYRMEPQAAG